MSAAPPRIMVVDDDRSLRSTVTYCLEQAGYRVLAIEDGATAVTLACAEQPDLVLLDINLQHISGLDVCRELRRRQFGMPILMLTGLATIDDRVDGLEAGADDYLPKPFDERELLARVRALLRREQRGTSSPTSVVVGDTSVDFVKRTAVRAGVPLRLTKTEFSLLELLAKNAGRPVSRKAILDGVWNYARTPNTRTVDTHIWRLRMKLGDTGTESQWLKFVPGQGYMLDIAAPT